MVIIIIIFIIIILIIIDVQGDVINITNIVAFILYIIQHTIIFVLVNLKSYLEIYIRIS